MLSAIDFYNQHLLEGYEVDNIGAYGLLPPELEAAHLLAPQYRPDGLLGIGLLMAEPASQSCLRSSTHVLFHPEY